MLFHHLQKTIHFLLFKRGESSHGCLPLFTELRSPRIAAGNHFTGIADEGSDTGRIIAPSGERALQCRAGRIFHRVMARSTICTEDGIAVWLHCNYFMHRGSFRRSVCRLIVTAAGKGCRYCCKACKTGFYGHQEKLYCSNV